MNGVESIDVMIMIGMPKTLLIARGIVSPSSPMTYPDT